jgi:hypothetical protein
MSDRRQRRTLERLDVRTAVLGFFLAVFGIVAAVQAVFDATHRRDALVGAAIGLGLGGVLLLMCLSDLGLLDRFDRNDSTRPPEER